MTSAPRVSRGAAMVEFALAWPVAVLLVLGCVELSVWSAESFAVRSAALAGARAASVAGASPEIAARIAQRSVAPSLVGTYATIWCPGMPAPARGVWICAKDLGSAIEVDVGGSVPALVPMFTGAGLPVHAHAVIQKEAFTR